MSQLPILEFRKEIHEKLESSNAMIIEAEPGAGKTTEVPRMLKKFGKVLVVQPRRLAAKLTANYVSELEKGKSKVGFQIRFENKITKDTDISFVTEGIFLNILQRNPLLEEYSSIVLDEFHERNLQTDIALAAIKKIQDRRPKLKLVVMSATLNAEPLKKYLKNSSHIKVPGKNFPVEIIYREPELRSLVEKSVYAAIKLAETTKFTNGNILVFSTGRDEISRIVSYLKSKVKNLEIYPLYSGSPASEQKRIFSDSNIRKIIVATNVAETSITIPNLEVVIDTGKAKISDYAPWSGLPILSVKDTARDSAIQRAGRAGRTKEGLCIRLYSEDNFRKRALQTAAEISRSDLSSFVLNVLSIFSSDSEKDFKNVLPWFELADEKKLSRSIESLKILSALDKNSHITKLGKELAKYPLDPRIAKIAVEAKNHDYQSEALLCALIISEGFLLKNNFKAPEKTNCDVSYQAQLFLKKERGEEFDYLSIEKNYSLKQHEIIKRIYESLEREKSLKKLSEINDISSDIIRECIMSGFSERLAKHRPNAKNRKGYSLRHFHFAGGRGGILSDSSGVSKEDFIIVLDAMENPDQKNSATRTQIKRASSISLDHLKSIDHTMKKNEIELEINEKKKSYKILKKLFFGNFIYDETIIELNSNSDTKILSSVIKSNWPFPFENAKDLENYHRKITLLDKAKIEHDLTIFEGEMFDLFLESVIEDHRDLTKIKNKSLMKHIEQQLSWEQKSLLDMHFPEQIKLENGKNFKVDYFTEEQIFISGRIQDFYGVNKHPEILNRKILIKLLAPNRRPAQLTTDISGFWSGSYVEIRKELKRRYPKHDWPEKP